MKVRKIKMSNKNNGQQKDLSEMIEKILFDAEELEILKGLISEVKIGRAEPKQLRTAIVKNREIILNKVVRIFPYYHKQISYQQQIDDFTERDLSPQLENELEEKNNLLKRVGEWMQNTRKRLEEKTNT